MRISILPALLVGFVQAEPGVRAQPAAAEKDDQQIARLIDQLASKRQKPEEGSKVIPIEEMHVWKAVDALHEFGIQAFPQLIAHFDDDRFSYSEDSLATERVYHHSVGYLCRKIVHGQVRKSVPWDDRDPRYSPGYGTVSVPGRKAEAQAWWGKNQHKPLWELQVDNLLDVVAQNHERLKKEDDPRRRRLCVDAIKANEQLVEKLRNTRTAIPTTPVRPYIGR